jgi:uncharacterized protein YfeS
MEDFEFTPETSHPKAKELLKEDFYWSDEDETSPFGNDDGAEASFGFWKWRKKNKNVSPLKYLEKLLNEWDFPYFDLNELNSDKIQEYITQNRDMDNGPFSGNMLADQLKQMAAELEDDPEDNHFKELLANVTGTSADNFLIGMDNAIIAVAFAQYALEGTLDTRLKALAQTAIKRELNPLLLETFSEEYRSVRAEKLNKMLASLNLMKE